MKIKQIKKQTSTDFKHMQTVPVEKRFKRTGQTFRAVSFMRGEVSGYPDFPPKP